MNAVSEIEIRETLEVDFEGILALNDTVAEQTSPMDRERLEFLHELSCYHRVAVVRERIAAFLLALRDGAHYENDNYLWFSGHLFRFMYVDRIVVASAFAGRGIGRALYEDLFDHARSLGIGKVVCEYNLRPPNPASAAFHRRLGFEEVGRQRVAGGSKVVSLQAVQI